MPLPNTGMTFTPFDPLSAAEMNDLVENIEALAAGTGLNDDSIVASTIDWASTGASAGIWWEEIGRATLGSSADVINITSFGARKHLMFRISLFATGGNTNAGVTFNNDTSANYALRVAINGVADTAVGSATELNMHPSVGGQSLDLYLHVANTSSQVKLATYTSVGSQGTSAVNAPHRAEGVGKWANTSAQITRIDVTNSSTGSYDTGSSIVVLGHD